MFNVLSLLMGHSLDYRNRNQTRFAHITCYSGHYKS
jgi:hypothetical protein